MPGARVPAHGKGARPDEGVGGGARGNERVEQSGARVRAGLDEVEDAGAQVSAPGEPECRGLRGHLAFRTDSLTVVLKNASAIARPTILANSFSACATSESDWGRFLAGLGGLTCMG